MSQRLYDNTLLAVALAISRDVVLSEGDILDDALRDRLSATLGDALFYRVTGPDGGFVTGYSELPPPSEAFDIAAESPKFYDSESRGAPVRVVALHEFIDEPQFGGWVDVHVWQTVRARDALSLRLAVQAGAMMALVILGAGSAVIFGIAYGLKPLLDLREAVERRSPADLGPIRRPVPREVKGLVEAMNQLFGRLAEAFATRDEFIANAAHQLRNPIAAIQAQAEAAVTAPTDREMRARARGVAEAARRTGRLTQQLLSMEKVRGRPDVATAEVDIEDVAAGVLRIYAPDAMRHGAEISLEVEGPPSPVRGDPVLLAEALDNLVDNALRYGCRGGGAVRVSIRFEPDRARVVVEDDGPGVPSEQRERIFERFHRGVEDGSDGCGLGLAIARETVTRHGGSIRLTDAAKGTRFEIDLPLSRAA
jgi:two-component system sensor histidine kinase TctE